MAEPPRAGENRTEKNRVDENRTEKNRTEKNRADENRTDPTARIAEPSRTLIAVGPRERP